jgi:hypothetical protein
MSVYQRDLSKDQRILERIIGRRPDGKKPSMGIAARDNYNKWRRYSDDFYGAQSHTKVST